jgi:uncharacterized protein (DUF2235 family)
MKNLVLLIALFFTCFFVNAQKMDKAFLEGQWETEFHDVEFSIINKKELKITILLKETNDTINVVGYQIDKNNLYMETYYQPNDWEAIGKLVIIDENTMAESVVSDAPGVLIYKRKK